MRNSEQDFGCCAREVLGTMEDLLSKQRIVPSILEAYDTSSKDMEQRGLLIRHPALLECDDTDLRLR
jgi:hypothetical protein